ncbi:MAG TPA: hypothetical protein VFL91_08160 [Thermomicrobiales bacterium]|nr:hypothetical protein [Thermomicrobiales bacterium]
MNATAQTIAGPARDRLRRYLGSRTGWVAFVTLAYVVATAAMTWPYAARLGGWVPPSEDSLLQVWIARWVQHALVTNPLHLYDANAFYPYRNTLAYSDSNVPAALLAAPLYLLTHNAIFANNLLVLGTFVLAAGGMCALVGHLSGNRWAGFLAGLAYAFLPYRYVHLWHLNQLGHAWTPWALLALVLLLERQTWRAAIACGLLASVQVVTSFYVGFQLAFAVGVVLVVAVVASPRMRTRRCLGRLAVAGLVAAAIVLPLALPYLQVRDQQGLERTIADAEGPTWYATPRSYVRTEGHNLIWGRLNRDNVREDTLFPGSLALAGAVLWLAGWRRRRAATVALAAIGVGAFVLSLGPTWDPAAGGTTPLPYRFLYEHFPFFAAMRVPARFGVLADFAVVGLAGLGAAWGWERLMPRLDARHLRRVGAALTVGLAALVLLELCSAPTPLERVDTSAQTAAPYRWLARQPAAPGRDAVMEFPVSLEGADLSRAMYLSTLDWKPLVQGYSGFAPRSYGDALSYFTGDLTRLDGTVAHRVSYVNAGNVGVLQDLGVRYLVLHREGYKREDWPSVLARLEGTGVANRAADFGDTVIYELAPPRARTAQPLVTLNAPALATPQTFWEPALVVRNPSGSLALLSITRPLTLRATWRDDAGRVVRRDTFPLNLPAIIPAGDLLCTVRLCPAASGVSVAQERPAANSLRLYPSRPGHYTVQLDLSGDVTLSRTIAVDVADTTPPPAADGPPIAFVSAAADTTTVAPGQVWTVTLTWQVRRPAPEDYTIFAQLIGPDGKVWGQLDSPAGWTSHYTSAWLPGERVSLPWPVPLKPDAPPGRYRLLIGMYRHTGSGIERVPVRWPDGDATEYWAGEIEVK